LTGAVGCGGETLVKLQGRVVVGGEPLQWTEPTPLTVGLTGVSPDPEKTGKAFTAEVQKDGTFVVESSPGKGIPAGKYTFTVRSVGGAPGTRPPAFLAPFVDSDKTPLKYEVTTDAEQKIVIDLTKQNVQRE
jgi:hypothetical protein